jgi:bla regulator protein blaR1
MITTHAASLWSSLGPTLSNHLWQSSLFGAGIWLATFLLRKNQAKVRYWLWLAGSAKFLLPFSLLISLGALLPKPHLLTTRPQIAVFSVLDATGQPFSGIALPSVSSVAHPIGLFAAWLPVAVAAVWLCGSLTVLLVWCLRWQQVAASVRIATPVEDGRELEILRRLQNLARLPQMSMQMRRSQQLMEPGVFGILRPVLLWPEPLSNQLDDEQIEAILTHEIMHARRRDNLTAMIHMLVEAAFWFHPMVWWMERRMTEERERACDEATVQLIGRPDVYAESLLKACRLCIESPLACVSGITGADLNRRIRSIMTLRPESLSRSKWLMLSALGLAAVLGPFALGFMRGSAIHSQILLKTGPRPAFEVATIKPSKPDEAKNQMMGTRDGYYSAKHMSFRELVKIAYQVNLDDQLVGASGWMDREYFDIDAKAGEPEIATMRRLGVAVSMEQFRLMLQSLLEDRFRLKVSSRVQDLPAYALVVARGGPKLKQVAVPPAYTGAVVPPPPPPPPISPVNGAAPTLAEPPHLPGIRKTGPNQVTVTGSRMSWFADWLLHQGELGNRLVVDKTGLLGNYDFELNGIQLGPETISGPAPAPPDDSTISIFTALQEQLGLKLIPTKAAVEALVIDHAEQPSAN